MSESLQLSTAELRVRLAKLPSAPTDGGMVALVVARPSAGERVTPARGRLTPERGLEGDRWAIGEKPLPRAQITLMRADIAGVIANGQPLSLFGDNLLVELDLSAHNLPVGARVRIGTALCEVTDKPHTGCVKFAGRFGQAARDILTEEPFARWRSRGIYVRVIEAGDVSPGNRIRVVARAPS